MTSRSWPRSRWSPTASVDRPANSLTPDHGGELGGRDPERPLERGQERRNPTQRGVGDGLRPGDRGEGRLLDAERVGSRGCHRLARRHGIRRHGIVTSTPKNVHVVSDGSIRCRPRLAASVCGRSSVPVGSTPSPRRPGPSTFAWTCSAHSWSDSRCDHAANASITSSTATSTFWTIGLHHPDRGDRSDGERRGRRRGRRSSLRRG